jgi:hypothetical protein
MSWEFKSPHPHQSQDPRSSPVIVLQITNASDVMASKVGKFLESLTPDGFDHTTIEDIVVRKLVENLAAQGIRGEVATVRGLDLQGNELVLQDRLHVRNSQVF